MKVQHGKFKGKTFKWMLSHQASYIGWLCSQPAGKMVRFFDLIEYALEHGKFNTYSFKD